MDQSQAQSLKRKMLGDQLLREYFPVGPAVAQIAQQQNNTGLSTVLQQEELRAGRLFQAAKDPLGQMVHKREFPLSASLQSVPPSSLLEQDHSSLVLSAQPSRTLRSMGACSTADDAAASAAAAAASSSSSSIMNLFLPQPNVRGGHPDSLRVSLCQQTQAHPISAMIPITSMLSRQLDPSNLLQRLALESSSKMASRPAGSPWFEQKVEESICEGTSKVLEANEESRIRMEISSRIAVPGTKIDSSCTEKRSFPEKVFFMLQDLEQMDADHAARGGGTDENSIGSHVISFVADGTAFMIHHPHLFENEVMLLYFNSKRLSSFQRQLNIYSFFRVEKGPFRGAYSHPYFQKGKPELLKKIVRCKRKKTVKK